MNPTPGWSRCTTQQVSWVSKGIAVSQVNVGERGGWGGLTLPVLGMSNKQITSGLKKKEVIVRKVCKGS